MTIRCKVGATLAVLWLMMLANFGVATAQNGGPPKVLTVQVEKIARPVQPGGKAELKLNLTITQPYHVNANPASEDFLIPTTATVAASKGIKVGKPVYPAAHKKKFGFFDKPLGVYEGTVTVKIPLAVAADAATGTRTISGTVEYQACNDKSCLQPATVPWNTQIAIGNADSGAAGSTGAGSTGAGSTGGGSTGDSVAGLFSGGASSWSDRLSGAPLWLQLILVFVGGLLLNLTPCVYPMIPITVGYFGAQSDGRTSKTVSLALFYVLGLALMYSVLGMTAALTGSLFGSALQSPYAVGFVALVLFVLSLSMFGLFTLQPPQFIMARSGAKKGFVGALAMGALLGIVAAPCVGPVVVALLAIVSKEANVVLGFALFFTLSIGLGLPYLLLGVFSGAIKALPRSGVWMEKLKKIFAVPLLVASLYYFYMAFNTATTVRPVSSIASSLKNQYNVYGLPTVVFIDAQGSERTDLRSGEELTHALMLEKLATLKSGVAKSNESVTPEHWPAATADALAEAKRNGQPVVLDFRADWCLPCLKMEREIFSREDVREAGRGVKLLKVDLTKG